MTASSLILSWFTIKRRGGSQASFKFKCEVASVDVTLTFMSHMV